MKNIILMVGLPASGKTTVAKKLLRSIDNSVRINRDELRNMLFDDKFEIEKQSRLKYTEEVIAKHYLKAEDITLIIDDTNLTEHTLDFWQNISGEEEAKLEYEILDVPLETCLERNKSRDKDITRKEMERMKCYFEKAMDRLGEEQK